MLVCTEFRIEKCVRSKYYPVHMYCEIVRFPPKLQADCIIPDDPGTAAKGQGDP